MQALDLFLHDILQRNVPIYDVDPDNVIYIVSSEGEVAMRPRGPRRVFIPLISVPVDLNKLAIDMIVRSVQDTEVIEVKSEQELLAKARLELGSRDLDLSSLVCGLGFNTRNTDVKLVHASHIEPDRVYALSGPEFLGVHVTNGGFMGQGDHGLALLNAANAIIPFRLVK